MKKIMVALTCRNCLYQTHKESETLILPEIEKTLKERLLKQTFFTARCPQCGSIIEFLHPCLYIDKTHGYILCIKSKKDFVESDHEQFQDTWLIKRYISNYKQIEEKIRMLDEGLHDGVIEILKIQLKKRYQDSVNIYYHDVDKHGVWFDIVSATQVQCIAVVKSSYDKIRQEIPIIKNDRFYEIDEEWAKKIIR